MTSRTPPTCCAAAHAAPRAAPARRPAAALPPARDSKGLKHLGAAAQRWCEANGGHPCLGEAVRSSPLRTSLLSGSSSSCATLPMLLVRFCAPLSTHMAARFQQETKFKSDRCSHPQLAAAIVRGLARGSSALLAPVFTKHGKTRRLWGVGCGQHENSVSLLFVGSSGAPAPRTSKFAMEVAARVGLQLLIDPGASSTVFAAGCATVGALRTLRCWWHLQQPANS